jgi:DNA ligase-1
VSEILSPMLCKDNLSSFIKAFGLKDVLWSIKEDGVRCIAHIGFLGVEYYSRNGKKFNNFGCFDKDLYNLAVNIRHAHGIIGPIWIDGEVVSKDRAFNSVMTQVHRLHEVDSSLFEFRVFDIIVPNTSTHFHARYQILQRAFSETPVKRIKLLDHEWCGSMGWQTEADILKYVTELTELGEEGIVLKYAMSPYTQDKSKFWCKVKLTETLDLPVVGIEEGDGKLVNKLGRFICKLPNGNLVKVAPGKASHEELAGFFRKPPKLIEVAYQSMTPAGSLRFPRFVRVREDKE